MGDVHRDAAQGGVRPSPGALRMHRASLGRAMQGSEFPKWALCVRRAGSIPAQGTFADSRPTAGTQPSKLSMRVRFPLSAPRAESRVRIAVCKTALEGAT